MTYTVAFKPSFLADYSKFDRNIQKRINFAVAELEQNPVTPRAETIKRLKHHDKLWRYRIGDYRMVYAAYPENKLVQLIGIGSRDDIYDRLSYRPDEPEYKDYSPVFEKALDPGQEKPEEWLHYSSPANQTTQNQLLPYRLTPALLLEWGVPEKYHHFFVQCETEDALQNCGASESYIFRLMDCLWPATANDIVNDPNYLLKSPQDLSLYATGDLEAFLLLLDDDQKGLVDWALKGPTLVKGGPGSGKSTVAIYRVNEILNNFSKGKKKTRVLFTTYTRALAEYSKQLIYYLLDDTLASTIYLEVTTFDSVSRSIVCDFEGSPDIATQQELTYALTSGRSILSSNSLIEDSSNIMKSLSSLDNDYLLEEFEWVIEGQGIETKDEYLRVDRSGRGFAFDQRLRSMVWELYQSYNNFLQTLRKTSWGALRKKALEYALSSMKNEEKWDYVFVDEAQDLTPIALALCTELCKSPAGIFLTADASQSIYNKGFAWKNVHDSMRVTGRTRILKRNYRTTRQIAVAAKSIINNSGAEDKEALDQIYVHVGPKPIVYEALDRTEGYVWLANNLSKAASELRLPMSSIAILSPQNFMAKEAAEQLTNYGLTTDYVSGGDISIKSPSAKAMTLHSSKGLEFPIVALIYIEAGFIPRNISDNRSENLEKHLAKELRLLFVGMTRAMRRLFVVYQCGKKSPFLNSIDINLWDLKSFGDKEE